MNELTIELSDRNGKHLYEQIYEYIKREIVEGRMCQNDKLPSTRALSLYLQISRSTVSLAYEQLLAEGYIESRRSSGYYVSKIDELYRLRIDNKEDTATTEVQRKQDYRYDFSPNAVDLDEFPYASWRKISKEILNQSENALFSHGDFRGEENLREAIREYLHASRGVNCNVSQIIIGAGNDYLLMLLQLLFSKNNVIAFENPTYVKAYRNFLAMGYQTKIVKMDRNGIQMEALKESGASIAYVMPSHQYPTGIVMPIGRRIELLKWSMQEEGRYIIEDDYDSEFRYRGKPIPSLQSSDTSGKVIYLGTFSKAIAPAIRISYMVLPPRLAKQYNKEGAFLSSTVSRMDQQILYTFMQEGYFERYLNRMRKRYREKHDILLSELHPFRSQFDVSGENAGLHLLLHAKGDIGERELIDRAEKAGVKVYGMSEYEIIQTKEPGTEDTLNTKKETGFKNAAGATIILGYAGIREKEIRAGIARLKDVWL